MMESREQFNSFNKGFADDFFFFYFIYNNKARFHLISPAATVRLYLNEMLSK